MRTSSRSPLVLTVVIATTLAAPPALAAESQEAIRIDEPVALKQANVVFNMDHAAFNGDKSIGLVQMQRMNGDLLPQFKVTTGAIFRITELLEQHYTELQP
jgi:hypothetical protein